jgi:hypothetical protein
MNYQQTIFLSKAAKVQRSCSSPSSGPFEIPKKYMITVSPNISSSSSIKYKKKKKLSTSVSSSSATSRPVQHLKMSASSSSNSSPSTSRFGKNLLPTWFGGNNSSNNENEASSPTSAASLLTSSNSITNFDSSVPVTPSAANELESNFETLLVRIYAHW